MSVKGGRLLPQVKGGIHMSKEEKSFLEEYQELSTFIREMQEAALEQADAVLSQKKELEYKKRQQEYLLDDQEKKRIPNISMFSPLNSDDMYENDIVQKDELQDIISQLEVAESKWEKQKEICNSFEHLKSFFYEFGNQKEYKKNLIDYSVKLLETQEMDRNRISRDLHDSTVQSLTSLGHKLEYCCKLVDKDPVRVKMELQSMIDLNKEIINGMREIIYDLRPMSLSNIGLVSTVEAFCQHLRRNDNLDVVFQVEGQEKNLSSIVSVTLYRIIQEACNNALRHSRAKRITIRIVFTEHDIKLCVEDNGVGFDIDKVEDRTKEDFLHGFGLSTMRERARLLAGTFSIDTKPGNGTKIKVFVPLNYTSRKEESYE